MQRHPWFVAVPLVVACAAPVQAEPRTPKPPPPATAAAVEADAARSPELKPEEKITTGSVTVSGKRIDYRAIAGTLVVHPRGADDEEDTPPPPAGDDKAPRPPAKPAAAMSFVAYFAGSAAADPRRPITFLYNGGPGSATVWLHIGAFGPRRVVTANDSHTAAAPYPLVNNDYTLLDASDLVFIDAPGTGFGKVVGKDKDKSFYNVDGDAYAFADFITQFLSKHGRWNSPKFLFGESYGTTRSAVLVNLLQQEKLLEVNGVILLSQILAFAASPDGPESSPAVDLPYQLSLPTFAATAWYHNKLPDPPPSLEPFLAEVERFALGDYGAALAAGNHLDPEQRRRVIEKLHRYTGLPAAYLDRANLRVSGGEFEKTLQDDAGLTTGRLDGRFSGPTMDPLSKESDYDPLTAAIGSAYVSAYNDYVRTQLQFGADKEYKPMQRLFRVWKWSHQHAGESFSWSGTLNVLPDLAAAMKFNPNLKIQLDAGYFDIATPFFQGVFELEHLRIPASLQGNIEMKFYPSGHMVYANEPSLKALHDNVAAFIRANDHSKR
jgi:carboxypeptidase C (cathepsin A)